MTAIADDRIQWYIETVGGPRVTWADTEAEARRNAELAGHEVVYIKPQVTLDLGWVNGWAQESPKWLIVNSCRQLKHRTVEEHDRARHVSRTTCPKCSYTYQADTSG